MILAAIGCCLGAAAFAATRPDPVGRTPDGSHPLQPRLTEEPDRVTTETVARFDSSQPGRPPARARPGKPLSFECRLDDGDWERCAPPVSFDGLRPGVHRFELRAVNTAGRWSPAARYAWRIRREPVEPAEPPQPPTAAPAPSAPTPPADPSPPPAQPVQPVQPVEPVRPVEPDERGEPFTIEQIAPLDDLFPGEPAQALTLRVVNPNPVPIAVTSLTYSFAAEPPDCPTDQNFIVVPSDASAATPLRIAAESSVELPAQGITPPLIAMRELPVDQNACQGAPLELNLEGDAQG
jgi:hypothetical protein